MAMFTCNQCGAGFDGRGCDCDARPDTPRDTPAANLIRCAGDALKLLESVAPHHPQTANLRAALDEMNGGR